ncbi:HD domain-containing protein [bacterium]|nr:HD domain-containing protein [bacterium]
MDTKNQLVKLTQIGISLSEERDLEKLFGKILEEARRFTNAEAGTLYVKDKDNLKFAVTQNSSIKNKGASLQLRGQCIPLTKNSMAGYVAITGAQLNIEDVYQLSSEEEYSFNKDFDAGDGYRSKSMLILPLKVPSGETIGVLQLINAKNPEHQVISFDKDQAELLQALASQAAVALHNAQLNETLKYAYLDTIYRLAMAAEYRDNETGYHVRRMSHYSAVIAEKMGLPEEYVEKILYAAPMHDIGKIGIPDRILKKEGPLTKEEFTIMKLHTTYGGRILAKSRSEILRISEEIALNHHEKWDGSGYPLGKSGEDIPISARIVAVADVFDALTSKRCYKDAYPVQKALKMIEAERGRYFDPKVLDAFMAGIEDILQIKVLYRDPQEESKAA